MKKDKKIEKNNVNLKELHDVLKETISNPSASEILNVARKTEKTKQLGTELSKLLEKS